MSLFDSLIDLAVDTTRIVTAPVEVVVDVAAAAIKPIADGAQSIVDSAKEITK